MLGGVEAGAGLLGQSPAIRFEFLSILVMPKTACDLQHMSSREGTLPGHQDYLRLLQYAAAVDRTGTTAMFRTDCRMLAPPRAQICRQWGFR